ncbi:hypothetical protein MNEG_1232 [Monoraphidium neglectum]|uniref:Uncharacterized protein n=1 Tax=Monoraphidium neglectum TaxID=145388 RepID=A0A0D2K960_9CHLO|nr:hypothetical protein MNEG_1232 [Monoraphidium neglectum]KIZ06723.1 hypothetical protein MNEG_1232 [Monoraphidium neglectum]|eukprot:XP_013905742.1 hypothetical protein MNEG_1232 [Monoraphidium neglectum]
MRRVSKYLQQLSCQLDALKALPLSTLVQLRAPVVVLLGPSTLRPKEVYAVRFVAPGSGGGAQQGCQHSAEQQQAPGPSAKELASAGKRLLRALIVQGGAIEEWTNVAAATKMFIMVQAPASQAPPAGFLPRRGFSLNLRKAFQVNIEVQLATGEWPEPAAASKQQQKPQQHTPQQQRQQGPSQLSLEEQLEVSMQLCDSASDSDDDQQRRRQRKDHYQQQQQQQQQGADDVGGGGTDTENGDGLLWLQCVHAVKGMRQTEQA